MKILFILSCISLAVIAGGCSQTTTINKFDEAAFLSADSVEPIDVPEELQSTTYVEDYYPAPEGKYPAPGEPPVSPLPPNFGKLLDENVPVQTPTSDK